jgi:hypothetical protein
VLASNFHVFDIAKNLSISFKVAVIEETLHTERKIKKMRKKEKNQGSDKFILFYIMHRCLLPFINTMKLAHNGRLQRQITDRNITWRVLFKIVKPVTGLACTIAYPLVSHQNRGWSWEAYSLLAAIVHKIVEAATAIAKIDDLFLI